MVPSMTRSNHRHRGPVETVKMNDLRLSAFQDVTRIYGEMERQQGSLKEVQDALRSGSTFDTAQSIRIGDAAEVIEITGVSGYGQFAGRLGSLQRQLSIKGGTLIG